MSSDSSTTYGPLTLRGWIAVVIAVASLLFIFTNWEQVDVSFVLFHATMPLMVALLLAFVGGGLTGALLYRRRAAT
ncbi:MAG: hypothetical protein ACK5MP_04955 [Nostocoides sp.]